MILGPNTPPTFAVLVWQWFNDPDLSLLPRASAGALVLFLLCALVLVGDRFIEWLVCERFNRWQFTGSRRAWLPGKNLWWPVVIFPLLVIPTLLLWSFALRWSFPDWLPSRYGLRFWSQELTYVGVLIGNSVLLALISATVAVIFAMGCLERAAYPRQGSLPKAVIAIPAFGASTVYSFWNSSRGIQLTGTMACARDYLGAYLFCLSLCLFSVRWPMATV
nr:hypothetical protein [Salinivibrio socompensis]